MISNSEPAHSLGKMLSLGPRLQQPLAFQLWLSHTCLSALGELGEEGPVCSWLALLWCSLLPFFCEWVWLCFKLELFVGKFSLYFHLSPWLPYSLGC